TSSFCSLLPASSIHLPPQAAKPTGKAQRSVAGAHCSSTPTSPKTMAPTAYPPETWPTTYLQPQGPPRAPPSLAHRCSQEETLRSRLLTPSSKPPPPPPAPRREIPSHSSSTSSRNARSPSPGDILAPPRSSRSSAGTPSSMPRTTAPSST
ncbi:hypothetical protein PTTG_11524, partial [Puccinia triticina 1-1 BBBD Race 1]|uniref:Uncharacterized protein n=1 Tax=Puccinia triticina (isolate 1-1 / race 1 (BBBD)) TaxID=630390 RepID=A0A0C4FE68_PUCT1